MARKKKVTAVKINSLSDDQRRIFGRMISGENIFLTGNAGTGKSFLVDAYTEYCEANGIKLLKAAPTGVAACNIGGVTLHRLFKLPIDIKSLLRKERDLPADLAETLNLADVILIDEISMTRLDVFDKVMRYIELANYERRLRKRRELQLILVGDFYQLSPVVPAADKKELELYYGKEIGNAFAFQSKYWQSLNVQLEKLTEVIRQEGDQEFCKALDLCKEGDASCLPFFTKNAAKAPSESAIWVCGKNATANALNQKKLAAIPTEERTSFAIYKGKCTKADKLCDEEFTFKVGARVIMLVNDSNGDYQNGSMGTITKFSSNSITVKLDNGNTTEVEPYEFAKYDYQVKEKKGTKDLVLKEIGKAIQYPMRLGFAVTVHKAQGQTYDEMNFNPEIFQDGQLYVALSRCRSIERLYISAPLYPRMVMTSKEVIEYYKNPINYTFFGAENDIVQVQTTKECVNAVILLTKVFPNHKEEIIKHLQALALADGGAEVIPEAESPLASAYDDKSDVKEKEIQNNDWLNEFLEPSDNDISDVPKLEKPIPERPESNDEDRGEQLNLFEFSPAPAEQPKAYKQGDVFFALGKEMPSSAYHHITSAKYIILDVETTGLRKNDDKIIQLCAYKCKVDISRLYSPIRYEPVITIENKFCTYVRPYWTTIPPQITQLTGITNQMIATAPTEDRVMKEFLTFCGVSVSKSSKYLALPTTIVAHNAEFDTGFIAAACKRLGFEISCSVIDTLSMARSLLPELSHHKMQNLCEHFDCQTTANHRADNDTSALTEIFGHLLHILYKKGNDLGAFSVSEMNSLCGIEKEIAEDDIPF